MFGYFYEHEKLCAAGASKHKAFTAYTGCSLRMVAEYFGVDTRNLKRNVERSPLYRAYVAAYAASDEGSTFGWQDQSAQVTDNTGCNQNISQQEFERELHVQPVHLSMSMSPSARCLHMRTHTLRARVHAPHFVRVVRCRRRARRRSACRRRACRHRA